MKTNTLSQFGSELQHLVNRLRVALPVSVQKPLRRLSYQITASKGWLLGLGLLLLWLWVWQWVLSVAVGLAVMVGVYLAQQGQLKLSWRGWRQLWSRTNRALSLSVLVGVVALGSTYLATAVWLESEQHWLSTSILLEWCGILAILGFLGWQFFQQQTQQQTQQAALFQQWLQDLSDPDPVRRLMAIRQTTHALLTAPTALPITAPHLADCFRLMLDRETESLVCNALIESLQALNPTRQLEGSALSSVTLKTPAKTKTVQPFSAEEA